MIVQDLIYRIPIQIYIVQYKIYCSLNLLILRDMI
jgi:hypothetical protein